MSEIKQIHHVGMVDTWRYKEDEYGQQQKVQVQRYVKSDVDRIVHSDGNTYEVQPDGSFHVPVEVARFYLRQPNWHEGPSPFAPEPVDELKPRRAARKPAEPVA